MGKYADNNVCLIWEHWCRVWAGTQNADTKLTEYGLLLPKVLSQLSYTFDKAAEDIVTFRWSFYAL